MGDLLDDYIKIKKCVYKGEKYFVRDNGAVMRAPKDPNKPRRWDNVWTFGIASDSNGYMNIAGQMVHRIVAYAFLGEPPTEYHVVDHIDTNRRNNRPDNLRWVTRLENVIKNPITRARIENICGSINAFLENPSILNGHESEDKNFSWMRSVPQEEARITLAKMTERAMATTRPGKNAQEDRMIQNNSNIDTNPSLDEFAKSSIEFDDWSEIQKNGIRCLTNNSNPDSTTTKMENNEPNCPLETQSLTTNAIQLNWKYPVLFSYCPQQFSGNPLEAYMENLKEGVTFCKNDYVESTVLRYGMPQPDCLWVMCKISMGFKTHAFTKITFKDGIFYHENKEICDIGDEPEELFESIMKGESI